MPARRFPRSSTPRRVATLSVHTSPLDQPGAGDAGGMNVYIVELARRLTALGTEVEIFTRATRSDVPPVVELAPGVLVRNVTAGPFEGLAKEDLPGQLCAVTAGVLRAEAQRDFQAAASEYSAALRLDPGFVAARASLSSVQPRPAESGHVRRASANVTAAVNNAGIGVGSSAADPAFQAAQRPVTISLEVRIP